MDGFLHFTRCRVQVPGLPDSYHACSRALRFVRAAFDRPRGDGGCGGRARAHPPVRRCRFPEWSLIENSASRTAFRRDFPQPVRGPPAFVQLDCSSYPLPSVRSHPASDRRNSLLALTDPPLSRFGSDCSNSSKLFQSGVSHIWLEPIRPPIRPDPTILLK